MGKLTKTQIDKLYNKTQSKQLELADGDNLYLLITIKGKCKFKFRVRANNKATWVAIGDYPNVSLNEARDKASECRKLLSDDIDPNLAKKQQVDKQITVTQLVDRYCNERLHIVRTKEASRNAFIRAVKMDIVNIIGDIPVCNINKDIIHNKLIKPKIDNGTPSAAKRTLINIKILMSFAVELEIINNNPVSTIQSINIHREKPRDRFLNMDELKKFLNLLYIAPIKTQHKFAFHLLLLVLTRKSELLTATWENVNFEQETFMINDSKMGSQLVIPLPHQALSIFQKLKGLSQGSTYIFKGRSGIQKPINLRVLNWILLNFNHNMFGDKQDKYFTVHDLRRTTASHLSEMSYPSDYIEVALNHSKSGIKKVYQRSTFIEQRKEMLQTWADKLDNLIDVDLLPYKKEYHI